MQYQVQYKWQFKDKIRYMWTRITFSSKSFKVMVRKYITSMHTAKIRK